MTRVPVGRFTGTGVELTPPTLPFPSSPYVLSPQARTVPLDVNARLWSPPAETAVRWVPAGRSTGTGVELMPPTLPFPSSPS